MKYLSLVAFAFTVVLANWLIVRFGLVPVWPGLLAPAGVWAIGLAFPIRDYVQRVLGRRWAVGALLAGAALSFLVAPRLAAASAATFLVSETVDMVVYTVLRRRFPLAVGASSAFALVVDSALFLWLAFGSEAFLAGQIVGKAEASAFGAAVVVALWWRREQGARLLPRHA